MVALDPARRHIIVEIAAVEKIAFPHGHKVVEARGIASVLLHLAQRRQQHPGQNGDDGDDHQEFNERETLQV